MLNDNTITLCSLAELNLTRYTIENAIGWTAHMEYDQIIKCQDDGKPVLNIKQRQEEYIRRIKESGLHFRVKRIFHVIHPNLTWKHECKFTDNAMRYLKLFVKNDIPFTLLPSEGMTEDLERLQQNSPPLYNIIIGHLEAKENSSTGTQEYIQADKLKAEIKRLEHENCMNGGEHFCMRRAICLGNLRNIINPIYHEQQEQPEFVKEIWHKVSEEANLTRPVVLSDGDKYMSPPCTFPFKDMSGFVKAMNKKYKANYTIWAYMDDLLNISSHQQEQPKVDLEQFDKDVTELWGRCAAEPNDSIACLHIETFIKVARHFWNKGYNARKEE